ncbi:MAG: MBL fold metallo-hydrolase [Flavobacterium sp.]|nr:MBL fold metallo-hydrolase [Flavobacterium sp.]
MTVYFLGTGTSQGMPVIGNRSAVSLSEDIKDKRLRVAVWIYDIDFSIVIDCGPDFRQQMLTSNCPNIDAILFTHEHSDHTAGLDDIRPFNFMQNQAIPVFAHNRVIENLKKRFDYIFETENKYPGAPSVLTNEIIKNQSFQIKNKSIIPIDALHGNLQVFGFKINNFAYVTDIKTIEKEEIKKLENLDVLVISCLHEREHHSHFNLNEALNFIDLVQPKKTYLTHISYTFGFHDEIQKKLPKNVFVAYDNLEITI